MKEEGRYKPYCLCISGGQKTVSTGIPQLPACHFIETESASTFEITKKAKMGGR